MSIWAVCCWTPVFSNRAPQMGHFNSRNVLSPSSGGWKSEITVSAALVPSQGCEGDSVLCPIESHGTLCGPIPSFWRYAGHLWYSSHLW